MIEFTKEELEEIRDNLHMPEDPKQLRHVYSAYLKLIEAIKSFCNHEKDGFFYLRKESFEIKSEVLQGDLNFNNAEYKCKKCGGFYK